MGDTSDEDHVSEQHSYHDEEGGAMCFMGKNSEKRMVDQRQLEGRRTIRRSMPQLRRNRVTEAVTAGVKGAGEQKGQGGYAKSEYGYKGFANVCDSQSLVLLPQPVYQSPHEGNRLMTTSWNGRNWTLRRTQLDWFQHEQVRSAS